MDGDCCDDYGGRRACGRASHCHSTCHWGGGIEGSQDHRAEPLSPAAAAAPSRKSVLPGVPEERQAGVLAAGQQDLGAMPVPSELRVQTEIQQRDVLKPTAAGGGSNRQGASDTNQPVQGRDMPDTAMTKDDLLSTVYQGVERFGFAAATLLLVLYVVRTDLLLPLVASHERFIDRVVANNDQQTEMLRIQTQVIQEIRMLVARSPGPDVSVPARRFGYEGPPGEVPVSVPLAPNKDGQ